MVVLEDIEDVLWHVLSFLGDFLALELNHGRLIDIGRVVLRHEVHEQGHAVLDEWIGSEVAEFAAEIVHVDRPNENAAKLLGHDISGLK